MDIPDTAVSDNGPQFRSSDFAHFSKKSGFEHTPLSPHHSRSNGKVESSVKSAKKMIRKAKKCGEDQYLALLNIPTIMLRLSSNLQTIVAWSETGSRTFI